MQYFLIHRNYNSNSCIDKYHLLSRKLM